MEVKQFVNEAGLKAAVDGLNALISGKLTAEALAQILVEYAKTEDVNDLIEEAIEASEKKIFGDGELAEAFDTIKEIGDYLKDHDDVAKTINEAIAKKLDKETYEADKETFETKENASKTYETISGAQEKYQPKGEYLTPEGLGTTLEEYAKTEEVEDMLEEYIKADELEAVPVATIQSWFAQGE